MPSSGNAYVKRLSAYYNVRGFAAHPLAVLEMISCLTGTLSVDVQQASERFAALAKTILS
jgi:hypothetical protein